MEGKDDDAAFARHGRVAPKGTTLFREGDPGAEMFVIQSGRIELTRTILGERHVVALLGAGEFFGEMAILNNRPRTATANVVEDARLIALDAAALEQMVLESSEIAVRLLKKLSLRFDHATEQLGKIMQKSARQRVLEALDQLADEKGQRDGTAVTLELTAIMLADRAGVPTLQAAEVLADLKLTGVLTEGKPSARGIRQVTIADRAQTSRPPGDRLAAALKAVPNSVGAVSVLSDGAVFETAGEVNAEALGALVALLAPALARTGAGLKLGQLQSAVFAYADGALHVVPGADGYLVVTGKADRNPEISLGKLHGLLTQRG